MLISFNDYTNKSVLESIKKIKIIHKILNLLSIKNKIFLKGQDTYIYVKSPYQGTDIKGIRIYPIANKIAFKAQASPEEIPQGNPYLLDFEKVYGELIDNYEKNNKDKKDNIIDNGDTSDASDTSDIKEKSDGGDENEIKAAEKVAKQFLYTLKQFFKHKEYNKENNIEPAINLGTNYSSSLYSKY